MKITVITGNMAISNIAKIKGPKADGLIKQFIFDEEKECCPGTSPSLIYAAELKGKQDHIPHILGILNVIEDVCCQNKAGGCIFCSPPSYPDLLFPRISKPTEMF